jgi:hypothetical protein
MIKKTTVNNDSDPYKLIGNKVCVCVGGWGVAYNNGYNRTKISVQKKKNRILTVIAKKIAKQQRE